MPDHKVAWRLRVVVFVVGSASLGTEIAAARLLAPYFGASTIVWANTIATVLLSLSVGYWLGGEARRPRPDISRAVPTRAVAVAVAVVALAVVPFAARPFLDSAVGALDSLSAGAAIGSLGAVLVLVAGPVMVLGAASPYAVRLAVRCVEESGSVAGRLYALTAGSLVGTFAAALLLVPFVGTHRTFLVRACADAGRRTVPWAARAAGAAGGRRAAGRPAGGDPDRQRRRQGRLRDRDAVSVRACTAGN